jgi:Beta-lactamase class A
MNRSLLLLALFASLSVGAAQSAAQPAALTPEQAVTRLLTASEIQEGWFAPELLQQVPFVALQAQFGSLRESYGTFQRLERRGGVQVAVFTGGTLALGLTLDAQGRFVTLGLTPLNAAEPPAPTLTAEQQQLGREVLTRLLTSDPLDASLLSADFLAAVPAEQLSDTFAAFRGQLGAFREVRPTAQAWQLVYERGAVPVILLTLDKAGKIDGLRVGPVVPRFTSLEEARAAFAALPGRVSLLVQEVGGPVLSSLNTSRPLAVGSTFKLAVLGEVQAQVQAGQLRWDEELTLTEAARSLPSGALALADAGGRYTVRDLANRMISQSDNTATDLLLARVGRAGVEARLGQSAMPDTRELFALKNPANRELLTAYRAAGLNRDARRAVLAQARSAPLPTAETFGAGPVAADVEWFVSTPRLCALMRDVAADPATSINPGVADKNDFPRVSYKGGSEPGVLNLTTQVTTRAGKTYCVSATWNDAQALDEASFMGLYGGVLSLLR